MKPVWHLRKYEKKNTGAVEEEILLRVTYL
jgi:hypothetical protein